MLVTVRIQPMIDIITCRAGVVQKTNLTTDPHGYILAEHSNEMIVVPVSAYTCTCISEIHRMLSYLVSIIMMIYTERGYRFILISTCIGNVSVYNQFGGIYADGIAQSKICFHDGPDSAAQKMGGDPSIRTG